MRRMMFLFAFLVMVVGTVVVGTASPAGPTHIIAAAVASSYDLDDLKTGAEWIALVRATGRDYVHWNSGDKRQWTSDMPGRALIYNDQQVDVVKALKGDLPTTPVIRNVGGTVGDFRYEIEGLKALEAGRTYLVFLKSFETPTKEGFETAISFVGQQQGLFEPAGAGWVNGDGLVIEALP